VRDGKPLDWEKFPYSELVGSYLLYLSKSTRPDIAQAVEVSVRYMLAPTKAHARVAFGVVRQLNMTATCGLTYGSGAPELESLLATLNRAAPQRGMSSSCAGEP
jgi:hypothetical protein